MRVACAQIPATTLDEAPNVWPVVDRLASSAAGQGADLLVLPETTYPAYWLESVDHYMHSRIERSARVLERFAALARRHNFWLIAGFVEEKSGRLFNSAAVFDRAGKLVHIARKSFLWDCDNRWFAPADKIAAFDSEFGRIGVLICADCRAPEITATLVADGARMIFMPTAWVNAAPRGQGFKNVHPEFLIRSRAIEFAVPFACCSKSGHEGDKLEYTGQSRIVDHRGELLAAAPAQGEHLIVASVEPGPGRPTELTDSLRGKLLGTAPPFRSTQPAAKVSLRTTASADEISAALQAAKVRVATFTPTELHSFAKPRVAAYEGAQVLLVRGRVGEESIARARCAENRVFLIAATDSVQMIIAPDGWPRWREDEPSTQIDLNIALADVKQYTPETDLWEQRRVSCYALEPREAATLA